VPALLSAHRGGPEDLLAPNSLAAIEAACALGVDFVEFDVRVTRDGQPVVVHDDRIEIEGKQRPVSSLDAQQLYQHHQRPGGAPSALPLGAVLEMIRGRARGHVDLKDVRAEVEIADACTAALGREGFVLTSLEDLSVRRLREARPELRVALSLGRNIIGLRRHQAAVLRASEVFPQARIRRCGANALAVNYQIARLGVLAWAARQHIPVLVWTLNTAELIRAAQRDERVWAYTTDYPRLAQRLAAESGR
jgi:glycerophosphoryl diester phosphodiesterase